MTRKDIAILLSPIIVLAIIAILSVGSDRQIKGYYDADQLRQHAEKFDGFVEKVQSGDLQLSQERMIEQMHRSRSVAESARALTLSTAEMISCFAYLAAGGILLQIGVVICVNKRLTRM